jgi:hypothetical protein
MAYDASGRIASKATTLTRVQGGSDQGRVFAESANSRPISRADAESTYGLKPGRGRDYVETDVDVACIEYRYNAKTRANEITVKGDIPLRNATIIRRA